MKVFILSVAVLVLSLVSTGHVVPSKHIHPSGLPNHVNRGSLRTNAQSDHKSFDNWVERDPWLDVILVSGSSNAPGKRGKKSRNGKGKKKSGKQLQIGGKFGESSSKGKKGPSIKALDPWGGPHVLVSGVTTNAPGKKGGNRSKDGKGKGKSGASARIQIDPWMDPTPADPWQGPDILMAGGTTNAPGRKRRNRGKSGKGKNDASAKILDPWNGPDVVMVGGYANAPGRKRLNGSKGGKRGGKH